MFDKCRQLTEERGIPRGVNLDRYPLSTLIRDITDGCGALLFGHKAQHKLEYECSRYRQSSGRECQRLRGRVEEGGGGASLQEEIDAAMALFDRIDRLTVQPDARTEIGEMLRDLNFRMWLRFQPNPRGKRPVAPNRKAGR